MTLHRRRPWKVLAAGVVVDGIAVAITVLVFPGVHEHASHPVLGYVELGLLFGVINALVKPVLQFVALPFLLQSLGVIVIIVDIVVFALLDAVTPRLLTVDSVWAIVAAGIVLGILSFGLENLVGLTPPIVKQRDGKRSAA
jgi:putative membrane protein